MLIDNIFFPKLESSKNSKKIKKWGSLTYQSQGPVPLIEEYNKWKNEGNTGEFIYEINP